MKYAIYPPIGLARIGNSPNEFFIGPESPGSIGTEVRPDNSEGPVTNWKDTGYKMKRQAARFQLFEIPEDGSPPRRAVLPPNASVQWEVQLTNKKDAVARPVAPPDQPVPIRLRAGRENRVIDSGLKSVSGANAPAVELAGTYLTKRVVLGEIRSDAAQRLLVLGGHGDSATLEGAPLGHDFYNNENWHDDVGDGPVTARVELPGQPPITATPAWVVIAPPDFAPGSRGIVTLYDVILQVAYDQGWLQGPARPFFHTEIRPLLERASSLQWVSQNSVWKQISLDWNILSDPSEAHRQERLANASRVKAAETVLQNFELRDWQTKSLDQWSNGDFDPGVGPAPGEAAELTRAVLDATVGQGFFPGIEAGVIVTNPDLYATPFEFRFNHSKVTPGDLTALMASPWQADFLKCSGGWWPAQRPDSAPQLTGPDREWLRPTFNHAQLVQHAMQLGVIAPQGNRAVETGRDPTLGP
jgi:L-Lysine epsilon oxidase N-terminal/L-lysine epsilon oxidase C-terminal domain